MKRDTFKPLYIFLFPLIFASCQTAHLIGYEVHNNTSEPVLVGAANLAYHGRELAPGESMELDVFIGPGNLKTAYATDTVYRNEVENSVSHIEQSNLGDFRFNWNYHWLGLSKGRGILEIQASPATPKDAAASR